MLRCDVRRAEIILPVEQRGLSEGCSIGLGLSSVDARVRVNEFTRRNTPSNESMLRYQQAMHPNREIAHYLYSEISAIKQAVSIAMSLIAADFSPPNT